MTMKGKYGWFSYVGEQNKKKKKDDIIRAIQLIVSLVAVSGHNDEG